MLPSLYAALADCMAPSCSVNHSMYQQSEMEFDVYFPSGSSANISQQTSPAHSLYSQPQMPPTYNPGTHAASLGYLNFS